MKNPIFKTIFRGSRCVLRGGCRSYNAQYARVSDRDSNVPTDTDNDLGFRIFRTKDKLWKILSSRQRSEPHTARDAVVAGTATLSTFGCRIAAASCRRTRAPILVFVFLERNLHEKSSTQITPTIFGPRGVRWWLARHRSARSGVASRLLHVAEHVRRSWFSYFQESIFVIVLTWVGEQGFVLHSIKTSIVIEIHVFWFYFLLYQSIFSLSQFR